MSDKITNLHLQVKAMMAQLEKIDEALYELGEPEAAELLIYRGYAMEVEFYPVDGVWVGLIEGVGAIEARDLEGAAEVFEELIDEYLGGEAQKFLETL